MNRYRVLFSGCLLMCSAGSSLGANIDENMGRLLAQPDVYAAVSEEADRQVESGEFFNEPAMKAAIAEVLGVDARDLPPIRLGPFPGATDGDVAATAAVAIDQAVSARSPDGVPETVDWQRALQAEALRPDVQATLQEALREHIRDGGQIAGGNHDEIVRKALPRMPSGNLRGLLEHALSVQKDIQLLELPAVSETLSLMSDEDRLLLAEHHDVLADHGRLLRKMPSWPPDLRTTARRFLTLSLHGATEPDRSDSDEAGRQDYWDRTGSPSRLDAYLDMIRSRELASSLGAGLGSMTRIPIFESSEFPEHQFEDFLLASASDFRPTPIPVYGTVPQSKVYVVPTTHGAIRVFTDTAFGAPMIVEETHIDDERATPTDAPGNYIIAGRQASVSLVKYAEDRWDTSVSAYNGRTSYHVEVGTKLENSALDSFVGFVRHLVENALDAPLPPKKSGFNATP